METINAYPLQEPDTKNVNFNRTPFFIIGISMHSYFECIGYQDIRYRRY